MGKPLGAAEPKKESSSSGETSSAAFDMRTLAAAVESITVPCASSFLPEDKSEASATSADDSDSDDPLVIEKEQDVVVAAAAARLRDDGVFGQDSDPNLSPDGRRKRKSSSARSPSEPRILETGSPKAHISELPSYQGACGPGSPWDRSGIDSPVCQNTGGPSSPAPQRTSDSGSPCNQTPTKAGQKCGSDRRQIRRRSRTGTPASTPPGSPAATPFCSQPPTIESTRPPRDSVHGPLRDGDGQLRDGDGLLRDGDVLLRVDNGPLRDGNGPLSDDDGLLRDGDDLLSDGDGKSCSSATVSNAKEETDTVRDEATVTREELTVWLSEAVSTLIDHLTSYGICVMDHFMGGAKCAALMEEIHRLEATEPFRDGQLMAADGKNAPSIRSDKIAWTEGVHPPCPTLRYLVQLVDSIVLAANRGAKTSATCTQFKTIIGRTKAMVACYPGNGSHYVKHVDNANNDGRVITAIYYTNKNWKLEDGGTLRIFSKCMNGAVADVLPIFDRIVFFWSDSRNPHEVLPAYRSRKETRCEQICGEELYEVPVIQQQKLNIDP